MDLLGFSIVATHPASKRKDPSPMEVNGTATGKDANRHQEGNELKSVKQQSYKQRQYDGGTDSKQRDISINERGSGNST